MIEIIYEIKGDLISQNIKYMGPDIDGWLG